MKKAKGKIDWTIAEDDEAWQASQKAAQLETTASPLRRQKLAVALTAALLLLMGGWLWPHSTPAKGASQKLPLSAAQASAPTTMPAEHPLTQTLTQTIEALGNSMRVDKLQRISDRIMTQVTIKYGEEGSTRAYCAQTRFYEKSASEWQPIPWQRIAPDPALLGPQKTLQIANFTILYRAVDADAVYEAAPKVEQLYATLRHDFGLPVADATSSYTIEVAIDGVQSVTNYNAHLRQMSVSSPIWLSAPVEMPPATLLYQAIVYPLARLTLNESMNLHDALWKGRFLFSWPSTVDALALWEVWGAGGPLASGRDPVVRWLYENGKGKTTRRSLPDDYAALCRSARIWQLTPSDLAIPLTCNKEETSLALSIPAPVLASTWLQPIGPSRTGVALAQGPYAAAVAIESILEYITAKYGRDKMPQLVAALGDHSGPEMLIPALFGVSQSDFEAGWQAYLAGLGSKNDRDR